MKTKKPKKIDPADLARMASEAAEKLKRETPKAPPHVPERVNTAKPCQVCGKPAVHFTGTGKGLDSEGKPFDEATGNYCQSCFSEALGQWGDPQDLLPELVGEVSKDPYVAALDRLTNVLAQSTKAIVLALGKIERRTGA
jgi:hypothetical protein